MVHHDSCLCDGASWKKLDSKKKVIYCGPCQKSEALPDDRPVDPAFCEVCGGETLPCFEGGYGEHHPAIAENVRILAARFNMSARVVFWKFLGARYGAPLETDGPGVILLRLMVKNPSIAAQIENGIFDRHLTETPLSLWGALTQE